MPRFLLVKGNLIIRFSEVFICLQYWIKNMNVSLFSELCLSKKQQMFCSDNILALFLLEVYAEVK